MTILRKGDLKAKPNPFEDITDKDKQLLAGVAKLKDEELFSMLYKLKEKNLKHRGISFEDFKDKHLNKPFVDLKDLVSIGCLDGFEYREDRVHVNADGVKEFAVLIPNTGDTSALRSGNELDGTNLMNNRFRPV